MTARLSELVPEGHVLRLAASHQSLPIAQCSIPDRCLPAVCELCKNSVHYDPAASIPILGPEFIMCDICYEAITI